MAHGRYTIVGKLADGGMAEIFLATQHGAEGFQKPVVLKRVLTAFSADPQFRNMFLDEAHISMSLSHGNIVQVLDIGVAGERTFLVLELVEGWDLEQILERAQATGPDHPWPPSLALYVTAQICRGLSYAHAKRAPDGRPLGIVHRDVSPNNVLISEQGEVKLADFGIAKADRKRERTIAGVIKGKIGFMSPEQALGQPLDARADIFAVGALMYLMLTGRKPFDAGSELESLVLAQRAEYRPTAELNPYLSPEATGIVDRAMQREPAQRYQTADHMLIDVERVLRGHYQSAGQTELKTWLADLARRDRVPPMGRLRKDADARPVFVDEAGELSAGSSLELSDVEEVAPDAVGTTATATVTTAAAVAPGLTPALAAAGAGEASHRLAPSSPLPSPLPSPFPSPSSSPPSAATRQSPWASRAPTAPAPTAPTRPLAGGRTAGAAGPPEKPGPSSLTAASATPSDDLASVHPSAIAGAGAAAAASAPHRRSARRSRVGLGFLLGAVCMLGAVFGIRWLAQWAGRERVGTADLATPAVREPSPPAAPLLPPALKPESSPSPPDSSSSLPSSSPSSLPSSLPSSGPAAQAADPVGVAAAGPSPDASATVADQPAEDDEDRLLGQVVPDAAPIIGEDEAELKALPATAPGRASKGKASRSRADTPPLADGRGTLAQGTEAPEAPGAAPGAVRAPTSAARGAQSGATAGEGARPAPVAASRAQPVQIRITTSPLGAVVRTKKHVLGRTPLAVRFNPGNTYELTFVKSGYVTHNRRVAVVAGKPRSISVAMKKARIPVRRGLLRGR